MSTITFTIVENDAIIVAEGRLKAGHVGESSQTVMKIITVQNMSMKKPEKSREKASEIVAGADK